MHFLPVADISLYTNMRPDEVRLRLSAAIGADGFFQPPDAVYRGNIQGAEFEMHRIIHADDENAFVPTTCGRLIVSNPGTTILLKIRIKKEVLFFTAAGIAFLIIVFLMTSIWPIPLVLLFAYAIIMVPFNIECKKMADDFRLMMDAQAVT